MARKPHLLPATQFNSLASCNNLKLDSKRPVKGQHVAYKYFNILIHICTDRLTCFDAGLTLTMSGMVHSVSG